jgi:hypothetical protein
MKEVVATLVNSLQALLSAWLWSLGTESSTGRELPVMELLHESLQMLRVGYHAP